MIDAQVDFDALAEHAVNAGLFSEDPSAVRVNMLAIDRYHRLPATLLDSPYGNGPMTIRIGRHDVPEASVYAVRRNVTAANELLAPVDRVLLYFHQRFVADDVFQSTAVTKLVNEYQAPGVDSYRTESIAAALGTRPKASALSFQVEGAGRNTHDRQLYTQEERVEALAFTERHPAAVLAILAYQGVLQDYFGALAAAFKSIATRTPTTITAKDLADFDDYVRQWRTGNFTDELVPALALFAKRRSVAGSADDVAVDLELFQLAVDFIIKYGAFRSWVTVPQDIAQDRQAHVIHFLCPAVGAVRDQLLDGSLLAHVHTIILEHHGHDDPRVGGQLAHIRAEALQKFEDRDRTPNDEERRRIEQPERVVVDGELRELSIDTALAAFMRGRPGLDDAILEAPMGAWLSDVLRAAVSASTERDAPVAFNFNGKDYRVTPDRIGAFLRRNQPS
jgi:hypothetical protein